MPLDLPNLTAGAAIGFFVGLVANHAYARYHARQSALEIQEKFGHLDGSYVAYPFKGDTDEIDFGSPNGLCRVTQQRGNVFLLRLEEFQHPNVWEALMWMETPSFGSMAWRYVQLGGQQPPLVHRNGFKRCLFSEGVNGSGKRRPFLYLLGEPPFGREALEKQE